MGYCRYKGLFQGGRKCTVHSFAILELEKKANLFPELLKLGSNAVAVLLGADPFCSCSSCNFFPVFISPSHKCHLLSGKTLKPCQHIHCYCSVRRTHVRRCIEYRVPGHIMRLWHHLKEEWVCPRFPPKILNHMTVVLHAIGGILQRHALQHPEKIREQTCIYIIQRGCDYIAISRSRTVLLGCLCCYIWPAHLRLSRWHKAPSGGITDTTSRKFGAVYSAPPFRIP